MLKVFVFLLVLSAAVGPAFAFEIGDLHSGLSNLSAEMAKALPFNSGIGLNWSDAYVGKLFPSVPPHFGVGGSFGFTTMDLKTIENLSKVLGYDMPFGAPRLYFPAYTAEARLGGFFLPFDIGLKFGMLPQTKLWGTSTKMNYLLLGAGLRYAILDGKSRTLLPNISIGLGFNYLKGGLSSSVNQAVNIGVNGASDQITLEKPDVALSWSSKSLELTMQISKNILLITPYLGFGASYSWSEVGYDADATVRYNGRAITPGDIIAIGNELGGISLGDGGLSSSKKDSAFGLRGFGGISLDLMVLHLDMTGLFNFFDKNYGAQIGFRVQL
ncbi:MAG: hypothetical protein LBF78_07880 [Treponema sp.]|nr:hypothetical protein [Treponema sp.]